MQHMSEGFDWVTSRFGCSLERVFKELELAAKSDVDTIRGLERDAAKETGSSLTHSFEAVSSGRRFSITRNDRGSGVLKSVEFTLDPPVISVRSDYEGGSSFSAAIRLNSDGRCLFVVDGAEMELWQVRRKALENLFFGAPQQQMVTVKARL